MTIPIKKITPEDLHLNNQTVLSRIAYLTSLSSRGLYEIFDLYSKGKIGEDKLKFNLGLLGVEKNEGLRILNYVKSNIQEIMFLLGKTEDERTIYSYHTINGKTYTFAHQKNQADCTFLAALNLIEGLYVIGQIPPYEVYKYDYVKSKREQHGLGGNSNTRGSLADSAEILFSTVGLKITRDPNITIKGILDSIGGLYRFQEHVIAIVKINDDSYLYLDSLLNEPRNITRYELLQKLKNDFNQSNRPDYYEINQK